LFATKQISGTALLQVKLGEFKTVFGGDQRAKSFNGALASAFGKQARSGRKESERSVGVTTLPKVLVQRVLLVYILPMSDIDDHHAPIGFFHPVDNPVIPNAKPQIPRKAPFQRFDVVVPPRILRKALKAAIEFRLQGLFRLLKALLCRLSQKDEIHRQFLRRRPDTGVTNPAAISFSAFRIRCFIATARESHISSRNVR
jgi:hypothetical protein